MQVTLKFLLTKLNEHKIIFSISTITKNVALFMLIPRRFGVVCFRRVTHPNGKLDKLMLFILNHFSH